MIVPTRCGLPEPVLAALSRCASRYPAVERVRLFGSRARGDFRERSDYDFAVEAPEMNHEDWSRFVIEVADALPTLCGLDIMRIGAGTPPSLFSSISEDSVSIYERDR